jgi:hypothetical protein
MAVPSAICAVGAQFACWKPRFGLLPALCLSLASCLPACLLHKVQESEYAAWVLVNGYALNHATVAGELHMGLALLP